MAINWDILKHRYLQTSRSSQMDSLSLNLIRLQALATGESGESMAHHLLRESQFFIEWSVSDMDLETDMPLATELISLQRQLSRWKLGWPQLWSSDLNRQQVAVVAQQWCDQLQGQQKAIAS
ncbi:MAG: hypothetical protein AAFR58_04775 [Cyanobacteria bacterium J06627_28]